ncbi:MAG: murein L,D-transpeptidase, partial [Thalassobium sp.]
MMMPAVRIPMFRSLTVVALAFALLLPARQVTAQVTAFRQAVAESAARDEALAEFYRARAFEG